MRHSTATITIGRKGDEYVPTVLEKGGKLLRVKRECCGRVTFCTQNRRVLLCAYAYVTQESCRITHFFKNISNITKNENIVFLSQNSQPKVWGKKYLGNIANNHCNLYRL